MPTVMEHSKLLPTIHWVWSHGLGQHPAYWNPLMAEFASDHDDHTVWDHGYYDAPVYRELSESTAELTIGVGHSLGFSQLLKHAPHLDAYICLQGFCWFCPPSAGVHGVPKTMVATMKKQLQLGAPDKVMEKFCQSAGIHLPPPSGIDLEQLLVDLDWLGEVNRPWPTQPVLAMVAKDDVVVPSGLTLLQARGNANVATHTFTTGNHALGLVNAEEIAQTIRTWVNNTVVQSAGNTPNTDKSASSLSA